MSRFSTGQPYLDDRIGEIQPGDVILYVLNRKRFNDIIFNVIIEYARNHHIPIRYPTIDESKSNLLNQNEKFRIYHLTGEKSVHKSIIKNIKIFCKSRFNKEYILLDDFSVWDKKAIIQSFTLLSDQAKRNKSVLVSSVVKNEIPDTILAELKDIATISVEVFEHRNQLWGFLLNTRGRYVSNIIQPIRLISETKAPIHGILKEPKYIEEINAEYLKTIEKVDEKYWELFNKIKEPLVIFDLDGKFRECNNETGRLLGYDISELNNLPFISFIAPESKRDALKYIKILRDKKSGTAKLTLLTKKKKKVLIEVRASMISEGLFVASLFELTNLQKLEDDLKKIEKEYYKIIKEISQPLIILHNGKIIQANKIFCKDFGVVNDDELKSIPLRKILSAESYKKLKVLSSAQDSSTRSDLPLLDFIRFDGTKLTYQCSCIRSFYDGKECDIILMSNITEYKNIIQNLEVLERRYHALVENSPDPACIIKQNNIIYTNKILRDIFKIKKDSPLTVEEYISLFDESDRGKILSFVKKSLDKNQNYSISDCKFVGNDGQNYSFDIITLPAVDKTIGDLFLFLHERTELNKLRVEADKRLGEIFLLKTLTNLLGDTRDISKIAQNSLYRVMETLKWEMGAIHLREIDTAILKIKSHRGIPDKLIRKIDVFDTGEGIGGLLAKTMEPHYFLTTKYPSYLPFRSAFKEAGINSVSFLPLIAGEKLIGIMSLFSRSVDSKSTYNNELYTILGHIIGNSISTAEALRKLQKLADHKSELLDHINDIPYSIAKDGKYIFLGQQVEIITGYKIKDFMRNPSLWLSLIHPDDKNILLNRSMNINETKDRHTTEYRLLPRGKAEYKWLRDTIVVRRNSDGNVERIDGIITDITDQKQLIDHLSTDLKLQSSIIEEVNAGIMAFDLQNKCILANKNIEEITGVGKVEIMGSKSHDLENLLQIPGLDGEIKKASGGEIACKEDIPLIARGKSERRYFKAVFSPYYENNKISGVVGIFIDVTERKVREEEVLDSEYLLKNVIDAMDDLLIITDLRGNVVKVNRTFTNTVGYSQIEAVGCEFPHPWLNEEEMGRFVLWIANLREHNWLHDFDMTMRRKDGRLLPVSMSTTLLRNKMGEPIAMVNVARDITERKRLTEQLEKKNKQIELLNRIIITANQTQDFSEIFRTIANEISTVVICHGISIAVVGPDNHTMKIFATQGLTVYDVDDVIQSKESLPYRVLQSQKALIEYDLRNYQVRSKDLRREVNIRSQLSIPIILRGRNFGTLNLVSKEPHTFTEEHIELLTPVAQQVGAIVDRVKLFEQVKNDADYIHNLLDSIDNVVFTVDRDLRIGEMNEAFRSYLQDYGIEDVSLYAGKHLYDVIRENSLKMVLKNIIPSMLDGNIRIFSHEYEHQTIGDLRTFQLMLNPMIINQKIIGLVFTLTDITEIKRTEAQLKKNNQQLIALSQISTLLSASLDVEELMESALPIVKNSLNAEAIIVYKHNMENDEIAIVSQIGFDLLEFGSVKKLQLSGSATGDVIISQHPIYIGKEPYNDQRIVAENRSVLKSLQIEAMAIIPLISKGKVFGALDIFFNTRHDFSPQDQQILTLVGNQLGAALHNLHLYNELHSQVERLSVLYDLSQSLTSTLDANEVFEQVFEHIRKIVSCSNFRIVFYSADKLHRTPVYEARCHSIEGFEIIKGKELNEYGYDEAETIAINTRSSCLSAQKDNLIIPMFSKDAIIGIMAVRCTEPHTFTPQQITILESIANLVAIAYEKVQLYQETLQKSIEIERQNKELDDFTYVVSHDLKEPLISVEGFSRILQTDYENIIQPEGKEYLDSIVGATTRMKGLIDDLLLLSRINRPSESFAVINARKVIEEIISDMAYTIHQRNVNISMPNNLPDLYCNGTHIKILFRNIISNAIKFNNKPNPQIQIEFRNAENNYYLFSIKDNGIGIEKEFFEKIFVIFQRLHPREEYEGSGAGLAIAKKIIELHKGKIWVESEVGVGTTFYFTLPGVNQPEI